MTSVMPISSLMEAFLLPPLGVVVSWDLTSPVKVSCSKSNSKQILMEFFIVWYRLNVSYKKYSLCYGFVLGGKKIHLRMLTRKESRFARLNILIFLAGLNTMSCLVTSVVITVANSLSRLARAV